MIKVELIKQVSEGITTYFVMRDNAVMYTTINEGFANEKYDAEVEFQKRLVKASREVVKSIEL